MREMRESAIGHDKALDLIADRLDFPLTEQETEDLREHLDFCEGCRTYAQAVNEDDEFLSGQSWDDDNDMGYEDDEFSPQGEDGGIGVAGDKPNKSDRLDTEDEDEDDGPDIAQGSPQGDDADEANDDASEGSGARSDDPGAKGDDSEDADDDDDAHGASGGMSLDDEDDDESGASDQASETSGGRGGSADRDEDDEDDLMPGNAEAEAAAGEEIAGQGKGGSAAGGPVPDEDPEDALAEAEADAMTDEELADAIGGDDLELQGDYFPDCAADGVEQAARLNGARINDRAKRDAEQAVRAEEGTEQTEYGKVAVYRSVRGLTRGRHGSYGVDYYVRPEASSSAAAVIRNAILRSRTGHTGVERGMSRGKLDSKNVYRVAMRDPRLFKRVNAPAPGNYLVWVMIDCSGSMAGAEIAQAASVARALADASTGTPTVRLAVWGWSTPFLQVQQWSYGAAAGVAKVWETGQATTDIFKLTELQMGGTPDTTVLEWAWKNITKECRSNEKPVIIMASDGFGDYRLPLVVEKAQKHGVIVKSVAIGHQVREDKQLQTFGKGNYVTWQGSIMDTARPLAMMIGRMASGL